MTERRRKMGDSIYGKRTLLPGRGRDGHFAPTTVVRRARGGVVATCVRFEYDEAKGLSEPVLSRGPICMSRDQAFGRSLLKR